MFSLKKTVFGALEGYNHSPQVTSLRKKKVHDACYDRGIPIFGGNGF